MTGNHIVSGAAMRFMFGVAILLFGLQASASIAQTSIAPRIDRLEREMRAVQRKVFPGGAGQTVEPQITGPAVSSMTPGTPAGSALTDITARLNALEAQLTSLTSQVEQDGFKLRQIEDSFASYRRATETRLKTLETAGIATAEPAGAAAAPAARAPIARPASARPVPARPRNDAPRAALIDTIERPDTGDTGEDLYTYGYRLWDAKLYPEAQTQLKSVVDKHAKHRRASYAQNLLGRAYLDDGKPALASVAFYDNYKKMPDGDRAPDSLYYLGQSLVKLKKNADACKVYDELLDVYPAKIGPALRADIARGKTEAKCK